MDLFEESYQLNSAKNISSFFFKFSYCFFFLQLDDIEKDKTTNAPVQKTTTAAPHSGEENKEKGENTLSEADILLLKVIGRFKAQKDGAIILFSVCPLTKMTLVVRKVTFWFANS